jgi:RNA polymerase sigma-70 factor (ECF subfamily)
MTDRLVSLEDIEAMPANDEDTERTATIEHLSQMIQRLKPLDRQVIVLYLEGLDATSTGEITGLSPANVAMKIHRIKNILKRWFHQGGLHAR